MGNVLAKTKKKGRQKIYPLLPLAFHETSFEDWAFGKKHVDAICVSLQAIRLQMMQEIILEYLGKTKESNSPFVGWDHPNYITFIHTKNTPLDKKFEPTGPVLSPTQPGLAQTVPEYKIVMLGAGAVGKSALTIQFVTGNFLDEYDPTIEDNYRRLCALGVSKKDYDKSPSIAGTDHVLFDILDTAGREEFSSMLDQWMREGQIFLLVFSVVYKESFKEIKHIRERILRCKDDANYPVIAVGNKCDLRVDSEVCDGYGGRSGSEVNMNEVYEWCNDNQIPYIETSAKQNKNVSLLYRQCVYEHREWYKRQSQ